MTTIRVNKLTPGTKLTLRYTNGGTERCSEDTFLGFQVEDGANKLHFDTLPEVYAYAKVKSLKALEEWEAPYSREPVDRRRVYMITRDDETRSFGAWYYVYNGRWCRGSGADALSFSARENDNCAKGGVKGS